MDGLVVPGLLLLVARELVLHDPPRVLAWRLLHDDRLMAVPGWLAWALPRPPAGLDRDPIGLALAGIATGLAAAYLVAALAGVTARARAVVLAAAAAVLVVLPTLALAAMGAATERPYGQDGGVVQLPLALEKILAGHTPYAADYSDSILGKQARVSGFWRDYGGNPILRHHAYLPGTHLLMLPFHLASRATLGWFDARFVTLLAWAAAAWIAARVVGGGARGLTAAACVLVSPLAYWQQIFGANDVLTAALLLAAVLAGERGRTATAAGLLGVACATKHMAWPYAPFLLVAWSGARGWRELGAAARTRLLRLAAVTAGAFAVVVLPIAALDLRAFWADVVLYNAGLGGDRYPLGGTPGFGVANLVVYAGGVSSLREAMPVGGLYLLLVPLGLWLLRAQVREGGAGFALLCGSAALVASVYVSRVAHANYLIVAAMLAPGGLLLHRRRAADVVLAPLLLLALAVEAVEQELLRATFEQAAAFGMQRRATGAGAALWPDGYPSLTSDPLGLLLATLLAGLAVVHLCAGLLGVGARVRRALVGVGVVAAIVVPAVTVAGLGRASGAVRAQDAWTAAVSPRTPVLEAWSPSFRRDPPRPVEPSAPIGLAAPLVRGTLAALGRLDPRLVLLLGVGMVAALLSAMASPARHPVVLAAALLTPAAAAGVVFGSPAMLALAGLLASHGLAGRPPWAAAVFAVTVALVPVAIFGAPVLIAHERWPWTTWAGLALGAAAAIAALMNAGTVPGLGLSNLFLYHGDPGALASAMLTAAAAVAFAAVLWASRRWRVPRPLLAAAGVTTALFVLPGASGHDVAIPLGLLAAAVAEAPPGSDIVA